MDKVHLLSLERSNIISDRSLLVNRKVQKIFCSAAGPAGSTGRHRMSAAAL